MIVCAISQVKRGRAGMVHSVVAEVCVHINTFATAIISDMFTPTVSSALAHGVTLANTIIVLV